MAKFNLLTNNNISSIEIDTPLIIAKPNDQAIFDAIISENSGERQGTHSTLTKAEVRGGGKKPRPQKHSGRSRQGSTRSPQWRGGGVVFGPKPTRNYKFRLNTKVVKLAFASAFTEKANNNCVYISDFSIPKISSKDANSILKTNKLLNKSILLVDNNVNIIKSFENIDKVCTKLPGTFSTRDIVQHKVLIISKECLESMGKTKGVNK